MEVRARYPSGEPAQQGRRGAVDAQAAREADAPTPGHDHLQAGQLRAAKTFLLRGVECRQHKGLNSRAKNSRISLRGTRTRTADERLQVSRPGSTFSLRR